MVDHRLSIVIQSSGINFSTSSLLYFIVSLFLYFYFFNYPAILSFLHRSNVFLTKIKWSIHNYNGSGFSQPNLCRTGHPQSRINFKCLYL